MYPNEHSTSTSTSERVHTPTSIPDSIDGDFCFSQNQTCATCPARFRCSDAFTFPGPGLCNLSALLEDLSGALRALATDAEARAETTGLAYGLAQSAEIVRRVKSCVEALGAGRS